MQSTGMKPSHTVQAGGDPHQRYMLLCALLKHSRGAELAEGARLPVLQQAVLEADSMEPLVAFPALVFALRVGSPARQCCTCPVARMQRTLKVAAGLHDPASSQHL